MQEPKRGLLVLGRTGRVRGESEVHDAPLRSLVPNLRDDRLSPSVSHPRKCDRRPRPRRLERDVREDRRRLGLHCRARHQRDRAVASLGGGGSRRRRQRHRRPPLGGHDGELRHPGGVRPPHRDGRTAGVRAVHGRREETVRRHVRRVRERVPDVGERVVQRGVLRRSRDAKGIGKDRGRDGRPRDELGAPAAAPVRGGAVLQDSPRLHRAPRGPAHRTSNSDLVPVPERRRRGRRDGLPRSRPHRHAEEGHGAAVAERARRRSQREGR
mmetsp:Transcript_17033/g.31838  ORF Transcript_17033/g.31838 Transcript_17033/m.31838 type:complete len:269 (+) Transcript_17033:638-1444(+)